MYKLVAEKGDAPLIDCIDEFAGTLPTHQTVPNYSNITQISNYPVEKVALVTNFNCHSAIALHTLDEIAVHLAIQAELHEKLAERLKSFTDSHGRIRSLAYRRIFYSCIYVHGFRAAGITAARGRWFNSKAIELLGSRGWEILDAFNMTSARPDGSADGMHYTGGVSQAVTEVMLGMLINTVSDSNLG